MKITKEQLKQIIKEELEATLAEQGMGTMKMKKPTPKQIKDIEQVAKVFPKTPVGDKIIDKVLAKYPRELEQLASELEKEQTKMAEADMVTGRGSTEDPEGYGQAGMAGGMGAPLIAALVGLPGYTALAAKIGYLLAPMGYLGITMTGGVAAGALLVYLAHKSASKADQRGSAPPRRGN